MSRDALNGQQFEQLDMFMPLDKIINEVRKGDSYQGNLSPREQWEDPNDPMYGESLRDHKLGGYEAPARYRSMIERDEAKPLWIEHEDDGLRLSDGHHRLAHMEAMGHTWIPVEHRFLPKT